MAAFPAGTRPANEIRLTPRDGPPVLGKLVGVDGDQVTFLPAPYWNVASRTIGLGQIATIEVTDRRRSASRAAWIGFGTGFAVTGVVCGAASKYNDDYEMCLLGSAVAGALTSLVGLTIGAINDAGQPRVYRFDKMDLEKRRKAVQRLVLQ